MLILARKASRGLHGSMQVLGDHVDQKGSIVQPERLRFDFSHNGSIDTLGLARIEAICQESLAKALPVYSKEVSLALARQINGDTPPRPPLFLYSSSAQAQPLSLRAVSLVSTHKVGAVESYGNPPLSGLGSPRARDE